MKRIGVLFLFLLITFCVHASEGFEDSVMIFKFQADIDSEQVFLASRVKKVDSVFMNKIDVFQENIMKKNYALNSKRKYLTTLLNFIHVIATSEDASTEFKNGVYQEALDFYPSIIAYSENGELENLLNAYPSKTLKSIPLLYNEPVLKEVLKKISINSPDVFLKYAYELFTLPYIRVLVEDVAAYAPVLAKKYLSSSNYVNYYLGSSENLKVLTIRKIKTEGGPAAKSYVLLDEIFSEKMSVVDAEIICQDKEILFKKLVALSQKENVLGLYSINAELEYLSIFHLRSYKQGGFPAISTFTPKEIFYLMVFSTKEQTTESISDLTRQIQKTPNFSLNENDLKNIPNQHLASFVNIFYQYGKTDLLSKILSDNGRKYILTKMNLEQEVKYSLKNADLLKTEEESIKPTPKEDKEIINPSSLSSITHKYEDAITAPTIIAEPIIKYSFPSIQLNDDEKQYLKYTKDINKALKNLPEIIETDDAKRFLDYVTEHYPDEIFANVNDLKSKSYCIKYLENAAINAPVSAKKYFTNQDNLVTFLLSKSTKPEIKKLFDIFTKYNLQSKSYLFLEDISSNKTTPEKIHDGLKNNTISYFSTLANAVLDTSPIAKYSLEKEINYEALKKIRSLNGGDIETKNELSRLSQNDLYALIVYGQEELFKNSFNQLFSELKNRKGTKTSTQFFTEVNYTHYRTFLKSCAHFNTLDDFLVYDNEKSKEDFFHLVFGNLEIEKNEIVEATEVADILVTLSNPVFKKMIHPFLKDEFLRVEKQNNQKGIAIYGLLCALVGDNASYDPLWFKALSKHYTFSSLSSTSLSSLKNVQNSITEISFFYNDDDGKTSYTNFIATYRNDPDWILEDIQTYVKISSRNGQRIEIYANKPEFDLNGPQEILKELKTLNQIPSIVIHRGHSFHTEKTIKQIDFSPKLVFLGSCGGYYKIAEALEKAPTAQFIATKQIGSKTINDPLIYLLNNELRQGHNIEWKKFWNQLENKFSTNPLFADYVPPHKNLDALFVQAFYQIIGL